MIRNRTYVEKMKLIGIGSTDAGSEEEQISLFPRHLELGKLKADTGSLFAHCHGNQSKTGAHFRRWSLAVGSSLAPTNTGQRTCMYYVRYYVACGAAIRVLPQGLGGARGAFAEVESHAYRRSSARLEGVSHDLQSQHRKAMSAENGLTGRGLTRTSDGSEKGLQVRTLSRETSTVCEPNGQFDKTMLMVTNSDIYSPVSSNIVGCLP